jgi:propionyl-CoA synthetase
MEAIYDTQPGEVFWAASDLGWAVGHSYIVYAPLLTGCTTVLYEGKPVGTPDAGAFWRVIAEHDVKVLFTAPTAFRAIKKEDSQGVQLRGHDLSRFRYLFLAGERLDPDTYHWATRLLGVPVIDHWWQTESGWPMAANCMGIEPLPVKPGSPTRPVPGFDVRILRESGELCEPNEEGAVAVRLPLPPGTLTTLWRADDRFVESYMTALPGSYVTGDGGHFDEDGYLFVMGRVDDVINVAGHRLSTGAIEEVLASHPDVAECAVIGVPDDLRGQVPLGLVVLKAGAERDAGEVDTELVTLVRDEIGAFACYRETRVVERLPKTRSGKVLRGTMRSIAAGREYSVPSTIDDPTVLVEIEAAVKRPQQARSS